VAGYATRLYPLTLNQPKALLKVQGKAIIDYILDEINTLPDVDAIYAVSNTKFAENFEGWARGARTEIPITVLDDGTTTEDTRRGAIGDIAFTIDQAHIADDMVIIAGDNLFTFPLAEYRRFFDEKHSDCVCVKRLADMEEVKRFGVATLDKDNRVLEMIEKPQQPKSNCVVFAEYMYKRETAALVKKYLAEGNKPDAPGYFVSWLCQQKPVYAYEMNGDCYDIGTPAAYEQAEHIDLSSKK
jgi:glucose-1-phosphate thymidylyltransferase